ncbi:SRPBCC domain-containing protein [Chloroflexi bacterium TSY]|nr:SRPBCC domain-containing protein [Chloroflexi bacterium TSY]
MDIQHSFAINAAPEKVYQAIASAAGIQGWWSKDSTIASAVGGQQILNFVKDGQPVVMKFNIDELTPSKKIIWTCTENGNPTWIGTTLTFEMKENNSGTDFSFVHGNFDEKWQGTPPYQSNVTIWQHFMNSLKSYCETGTGQPW